MSDENIFYPVYLNLEGRNCVVIGGGSVAFRKIDALLSHGASVRVVSPEINSSIMRLKGIDIREKHYQSIDIEGAFLVFAATDSEETNTKVSMDCNRLNILCNVVDKPSMCNFIVPSIVEKGPIKIAISTGGASPALSKRLKQEIAVAIGDEYEVLARIMGRIRPIVLSQNGSMESHKRVFETLINSSILEAIRKSKFEDVKKILKASLGAEVDLEGIL